MFTGIIQATGKLARIEPLGGDLRLTFDVGELVTRIDASRLAVGESVAVSGACLTVIAFDGRCFSADVTRVSLRVITLRPTASTLILNTEPSLSPIEPLGG